MGSRQVSGRISAGAKNKARKGISFRAGKCLLRRLDVSGQNLFHHVAMDVRQAEIAALEPIGQPLVIDPEAVQQRGVEIVNMDRILGDVVAEVVGLPVRDARFDAAAGRPHRKAPRMVVATVVLPREASLTTRESFRLCGYVVGDAGGRVMGVGERANIDPGNRWRYLDENFYRSSQHLKKEYRLYGGCGRWAWSVGVAWAWVSVAIFTLTAAKGIYTKLA